MSHEIPQKYDPKVEEAKVRALWEDQKVYKFDPKTTKEIFSIDTPPPTMSGRMHIGHASSYTQTDLIARFKRMRGFEVFYPFGTDDNGLASQKLIQKERKVNLQKMDRDEAIKICIAYLNEKRPEFIEDWKQIGVSCDFDIAYSTIDAHSQRIAQRTFLELVKKGLAYKKKGPVMWDRVFQTPIAQAELEDAEVKSTLNYIKAKITEDENTFIIYATTRPELIYGCVGINVEDVGTYVKIKVGDEYWITGKTTLEEKYADIEHTVIEELKGSDIIGKHVTIPLSNKQIKITHDESVKADYGTGVVYYCTYGGLDCVEWMARYPAIEPIEIQDKAGRLINSGKFDGEIASTDGRRLILVELEEQKLLIKKEKITHTVNVGERSGVEVEYIVAEQWYIKYLDKKEQMLKAAAELNWTPQFMKHRVDNWIKGLNWDWGFSRQRHYGTPIPVWYDEAGNKYYPQESQLPVDPFKDRPSGVDVTVKLTPETDVFDTWFTSASTPSIATELMPVDLRPKLFPMNLRPQAHDIINFWLFYTMAKTQLLKGVNPWKDVGISGWVLDPKGKKMSKSKGNIVVPQEVMEKFSADAIRFWASGAKLGDDYSYAERDLQTANKLVTKLWNASKFADFHLQDYDGIKPAKLEAIDSWIIAKLNATITAATTAFESYDYAKAKREIESFFWNDLCDNYLEIVKDRLYKPEVYGADARKSGQWSVKLVFENVLRLFAPFVPYVTESLYQYFFTEKGLTSIHQSSWPSVILEVASDTTVGDVAVEIVASVRRAKAEAGVSLAKDLSSVTISCGEEIKSGLQSFLADIKGATKTDEIIFASAKETTTSIEIKKDV